MTGIDFNPPSIEQFTDQIQEVESLTRSNFVYWTKTGTKHHLYSDCRYINTNRTTEIFEGTVQEARELKTSQSFAQLAGHGQKSLKSMNLLL
ncbi:MAG: hypothetical protein ACK4KT_02675 [Thermaurantimonas sp.]